MIRVVAFALITTCLFAPAANARQAAKKYRELGIEIAVPHSYEELPTHPGEEWVVLSFAEKVGDPKRKSTKIRRIRPTMKVVWIDYVPDPEPAAEGPPPTDPEEGDDDGEEGQAKKAPPPPISNIDRFAAQELSKFIPGDAEDERRRGDWRARTFELSPASGKQSPMGFVWAWESDARTIALIGFCHKDDFVEQRKLWKKTAARIKITEPKGTSHKELERYYSRGKWSHPEYRLEVRKSLVRGWKAEDTENFIVVYHTKDQPLVRKICRDMELIRGEYMKLFPPAAEFDAVSTVRICRDKAEYLSYSGWLGTAGYWSSTTEELVLYDARKVEKQKRSDDSNTFIILYHEAFHQYIYYSTGELPPHSWFNEGYGDFFSGATIKNGKVREIGPNPWRLARIRRAVERATAAPWKDIIRWSKKKYYANGGQNYAQGWSMIYFLNKSPVVARRPVWKKILPTYFETLKTTYAEELDGYGDEPTKSQKGAAGEYARSKAVEAAFEDVDLTEIDRKWQQFVLELDVPRR